MRKLLCVALLAALAAAQDEVAAEVELPAAPEAKPEQPATPAAEAAEAPTRDAPEEEPVIKTSEGSEESAPAVKRSLAQATGSQKDWAARYQEARSGEPLRRPAPHTPPHRPPFLPSLCRRTPRGRSERTRRIRRRSTRMRRCHSPTRPAPTPALVSSAPRALSSTFLLLSLQRRLLEEYVPEDPPHICRQWRESSFRDPQFSNGNPAPNGCCYCVCQECSGPGATCRCPACDDCNGVVWAR